MPRIDVVSFFDRIGCMVVLYCVVLCVYSVAAQVCPSLCLFRGVWIDFFTKICFKNNKWSFVWNFR